MDRDLERFCKDFGGRVKAAREARELTQEDMMERGFSLRHFQRIEAGRSITLRTLWKLAEALDVEPRDLLPTRPRATKPAAKPRRPAARGRR